MHYSKHLLILIASFVAALCSIPANSAVIHGWIYLRTNEGWDFSDSCTVVYGEGLWDFAIFHGLDENYQVLDALAAPFGIAETDSVFHEVTTAPSDSLVYLDAIEWYSFNRCYFAKTAEGHYTKLRIENTGSPHGAPYLVEYVYQPDGSTKLKDPVSNEYSTWSSIKAFFKR